jgi:hypothetical protein
MFLEIGTLKKQHFRTIRLSENAGTGLENTDDV